MDRVMLTLCAMLAAGRSPMHTPASAAAAQFRFIRLSTTIYATPGEQSPPRAAIIWHGIGFEYSAGHIVGEPCLVRGPQGDDRYRLRIAQDKFAAARRAD